MTPIQIKIVVAIALIGSGIWIRGVFAERDELKQAHALAEATTRMYADAWNRNEQLQKEIVHAVQKIRVQSNNYIAAVETAPAPVGPVVTLVAAGVPETVPGLSGFAGYSAAGTGAAAERR